MSSTFRRIRWACACVVLIVAAATAVRAETHRFVPEKFFNTYSAAHPPVLHVKPGDRVVTKTVDAAGVDWNGKTVATGPNPETGPFFVDGAEPGDVLIVTLEKVETNRTTAYSGSLLSPYATTPQAIGARTDREAKRLTWTIDKAKNVARLDQTDIQPGGIEFPLRPMLGCIGVAPARGEAISTATPGAWGGNMDYTWMGAGAKLMLPVNERGALLFLGDGHARMGEGEVVGTGLETSMDVEFTVELIKKKAIGWPRLETATHVMVLGSARPLLEAFQIATNELQRWLMADYGFTERGAQAFMGQAAEYEVANIVDPSFTVVAKIPKALLAGRPAR
jgi:acetamidase/formamidase